jgi:DNA-binding response OmpR family regulator
LPRCAPVSRRRALPQCNSIHGALRLRKLPATQAVPIIATSASPTKEFESRSREVGANAFVSKPVEEAVLLRAIAILLRLAWIFDEPPAKGAQSMEADVVPPPPAEMQVLRELALAGNMRSIRDRADYVRTLDLRYAAFAAQLRALAEGYQSSAITNLIERYTNV